MAAPTKVIRQLMWSDRAADPALKITFEISRLADRR
jgi:hypothetical protein